MLSDLNLSSRDSKILLPALISFFENFEKKCETMFNGMKDELLSKIDERDSTISDMKATLNSMQIQISKLEKQIDDSEASEHRDGIIFNGPAIPAVSSLENTTVLVQDLLRTEFSRNISTSDISSAHRIGSKRPNQGPDNRPIKIKLCRRDMKQPILSASKNQPRPTRLYANESLTPRRRQIFKTLRSMKRAHPELVKGVSTHDGKVFAYTPNPNSESGRDSRHLVTDYDAMVKFCREYVKKPIDTFLDSWAFH